MALDRPKASCCCCWPGGHAHPPIRAYLEVALASEAAVIGGDGQCSRMVGMGSVMALMMIVIQIP